MTRFWFQDWLTVAAPPGLGPGSAPKLWTGDPERRPAPPGPCPSDLRGLAVLHVGCDAGALCIEAIRRGATRVVGVDRDPDRIGLARSYAAVAGFPAEFMVHDERDDLPSGRFDVVICSDLGAFRDPAGLLDRLGRVADQTLVVEWEGLASSGASRVLARHGAPRASSAVESLPVVLVGDEQAPRARSYLTSAAVRSLLQGRSARFSHIEIVPLGSGGRYRAVATRRIVTRLVVVAAAGASEAAWIVRKLRAGEAPPELLECIGLVSPDLWEFAPDGRIELSSGRVTPGLVVGYDLHAAWRHEAGRFGGDHLGDLVDSAAEVHVITSWAEPEVLKRRGRIRVGHASLKLRRLERQPLRVLLGEVARLARRAASAPPSRWTPSRLRRFLGRARRELDMDRRTERERARMQARQADERAYRRTEEHLLRYARWLDYCHDVGADGHWILDTSLETWRVEAADRWGHLLIERARRRHRTS